MGAAGVFLAAFSLSSLDQFWCAIPAGVCATFLAIGALTGWCPTQLLPRTPARVHPNAFGYDEARQSFDIRPPLSGDRPDEHPRRGHETEKA